MTLIEKTLNAGRIGFRGNCQTITSVACFLLLTACTATMPTATAKLGPSPALGGGTYSSGGGITVAADVQDYEGRTLVCGVWAQSRQQSILTKLVEPRLLGSGAVFLDRETLVRGILFMREVSPSADYSGMNANCVVTDRPWRPADEAKQVTVRIPRQVVADESDGLGIFGGPVVVFRPTGPGAGTD